jgi:hypothetical protein
MNPSSKNQSAPTAILSCLKWKWGWFSEQKHTRITLKSKGCRFIWASKTPWSSATVATCFRLRPQQSITSRKTTRVICFQSRRLSIWPSAVSGVRTALRIFAHNAARSLIIWATLVKRLKDMQMLQRADSAWKSSNNLQVDATQRLETAAIVKNA